MSDKQESVAQDDTPQVDLSFTKDADAAKIAREVTAAITAAQVFLDYRQITLNVVVTISDQL